MTKSELIRYLTESNDHSLSFYTKKELEILKSKRDSGEDISNYIEVYDSTLAPPDHNLVESLINGEHLSVLKLNILKEFKDNEKIYKVDFTKFISMDDFINAINWCNTNFSKEIIESALYTIKFTEDSKRILESLPLEMLVRYSNRLPNLVNLIIICEKLKIAYDSHLDMCEIYSNKEQLLRLGVNLSNRYTDNHYKFYVMEKYPKIYNYVMRNTNTRYANETTLILYIEVIGSMYGDDINIVKSDTFFNLTYEQPSLLKEYCRLLLTGFDSLIYSALQLDTSLCIEILNESIDSMSQPNIPNTIHGFKEVM